MGNRNSLKYIKQTLKKNVKIDQKAIYLNANDAKPVYSFCFSQMDKEAMSLH